MARRAIILAAGRGKRLGPHTATLPKCLAALSDSQTLLSWQLDQCLEVGVRHVVVLTGYGMEQVEEALAAWTAAHPESAMELTTVYNPFFATTNNMFSLWAARHFMDEDFLTINGDTMCRTSMLAAVVAEQRYPILVPVARHATYDAEDMKVRVEGGRIVALNKEIDVDEADGESVGVRKFMGEGRQLMLDELEAMARDSDPAKAWYVTAVERIAERGGPVGLIYVETDDCMDVDFPEDLERARDLFSCR